MSRGMQARVHDPLWLLARQWQFGEFQGEDAGSPINARLDVSQSTLSAYAPGDPQSISPTSVRGYNPAAAPLETLAEREAIRSGGRDNYRLAVEAGLHFLRWLGHGNLLSDDAVEKYRKAYLDYYTLTPPVGLDSLDGETVRFLELMSGRVIDGARLYEDLSGIPRAESGVLTGLPASPLIEPGYEYQVVGLIASNWLEWYETLFSESAENEAAWNPERMEYQFAVAAPALEAGGSELVLAAPEYVEGSLDWYSFVQKSGVKYGAQGDAARAVRSVIPAPVSFRGMPARRWWEFEDAQIDFGAVRATPEDLARMLMVEFALTYGNDWFLVPLELQVGTLCKITELFVTDTFGHSARIEHYTAVDGSNGPWRMFSLSPDPYDSPAPADPNLFFLPPALGASLQGPALEEVLFLRDEMANMAWAVERLVESLAGVATDRSSAYRESLTREARGAGQEPVPAAGTLLYRLATSVPDYWIPLLPETASPTEPALRLKLGSMLAPDGFEKPPTSQGLILQPLEANEATSGETLRLYAEEVPREGAQVARAYQYARWTDGSTYLWVGRRKRPGRGEGSSGLRFDSAS